MFVIFLSTYSLIPCVMHSDDDLTASNNSIHGTSCGQPVHADFSSVIHVVRNESEHLLRFPTCRMDEARTSQFFLFKDTIARYVLSRMNDQQADQEEEGSELDEFVSYLASEAWPTLPTATQDATYDTREKVPEIDEIPLESTSTAFIDSLISYGIVEDADDAYRLFKRILDDYREQACAPPPVWSSTRTTECEICAREVPLTYHHLIPRAAHAKVLKKGWHPGSIINSVAWLCR